MRIEYQCLPCAVNSFVKRLDKYDLAVEQKDKAAKEFFREVSELDFEISPPELGRLLHRRIKKLINDPDPFKDEKHKSNRMIMDHYDELQKMIEKADDPFKFALKLTLYGNHIDSVFNDNINSDNLFDEIRELHINLDRSNELRHEIEKAGKVLYLGDNCGEIVFDKLFLKNCNLFFPGIEFIFVVRSEPIINDATMEDADFVKMGEVAEVIENGYDAPGTVLKHCSEEFLNHYSSADLIISKGQGNFETLNDSGQNIYFLLMTKCDFVSRCFGQKPGNLVVASKDDIIEQE